MQLFGLTIYSVATIFISISDLRYRIIRNRDLIIFLIVSVIFLKSHLGDFKIIDLDFPMLSCFSPTVSRENRSWRSQTFLGCFVLDFKLLQLARGAGYFMDSWWTLCNR